MPDGAGSRAMAWSKRDQRDGERRQAGRDGSEDADAPARQVQQDGGRQRDEHRRQGDGDARQPTLADDDRRQDEPAEDRRRQVRGRLGDGDPEGAEDRTRVHAQEVDAGEDGQELLERRCRRGSWGSGPSATLMPIPVM